MSGPTAQTFALTSIDVAQLFIQFVFKALNFGLRRLHFNEVLIPLLLQRTFFLVEVGKCFVHCCFFAHKRVNSFVCLL